MKKCLVLFLAVTFSSNLFAQKDEEVIVKDVVKDVMNQGSVERVRFKLHSGIYYLKSNQKDFQKIKQALMTSQVTQKEIRVKADPTYLEISGLLP